MHHGTQQNVLLYSAIIIDVVTNCKLGLWTRTRSRSRSRMCSGSTRTKTLPRYISDHNDLVSLNLILRLVNGVVWMWTILSCFGAFWFQFSAPLSRCYIILAQSEIMRRCTPIFLGRCSANWFSTCWAQKNLYRPQQFSFPFDNGMP